MGNKYQAPYNTSMENKDMWCKLVKPSQHTTAWRRPNSRFINIPSYQPENGEEHRTLAAQKDCSYDTQREKSNHVTNLRSRGATGLFLVTFPTFPPFGAKVVMTT